MYFKTLLFLSFSFIFSVEARTLVEIDLKEELYRETSSDQKSYDYKEARRKLFNELHLEKDNQGYFVRGVYCLNKIYPFNGAHPGNRLPDANIINTEHTWPQSKFSSRFPKNVQKTDLHHLFPTESKINSQRGNYPFAEVRKDRNVHCSDSQMGSPVTGEGGTYFEPAQNHKGNVARAMFYFSVRYKIEIDPVQEFFFRQWHEEDPVDEAERKRNDAIGALQNNRNPFIDDPELVREISDF